MKKSTFTNFEIISEHDFRNIIHHMREEELTAAKRKTEISELPKKLEEALLGDESMRRIDRGTWQVRNILSEEFEEEGLYCVSFEMKVFQEGIIVFESYSESGEVYPGEDADHGRNSFYSEYWIPFDAE